MLSSFKASLLSLLLIFVALGCVSRTMVIRTEPPGATVYVDDELMGESPVEVPFVHYGVRKITLEKRDEDGRLAYKRLTVYTKLSPPYYQVFPLDFFTDVVVPVEIKDEQILSFELEPIEFRPPKELREELLQEAEELRRRAFEPEAD